MHRKIFMGPANENNLFSGKREAIPVGAPEVYKSTDGCSMSQDMDPSSVELRGGTMDNLADNAIDCIEERLSLPLSHLCYLTGKHN